MRRGLRAGEQRNTLRKEWSARSGRAERASGHLIKAKRPPPLPPLLLAATACEAAIPACSGYSRDTGLYLSLGTSVPVI